MAKLQLQLPDGRLTRRFRGEATVADVIAFIGVSGGAATVTFASDASCSAW